MSLANTFATCWRWLPRALSHPNGAAHRAEFGSRNDREEWHRARILALPEGTMKMVPSSDATVVDATGAGTVSTPGTLRPGQPAMTFPPQSAMRIASRRSASPTTARSRPWMQFVRLDQADLWSSMDVSGTVNDRTRLSHRLLHR
ncbi:hypothetical protein RHIZ404_230255 [Rhizobium sp. EC-SD404]|nr:hypothetical protein RHIZ404_230255 [Rhizobium sp. EC-SD404]